MRKVVFALAIVGWFFVPLGIAIGRQGLSAIGKHRHDFASVSYVIQVHYEVKQRRFQMFGDDFINSTSGRAAFGWDYDIVWRHERAHCNGWRHPD